MSMASRTRISIDEKRPQFPSTRAGRTATPAAGTSQQSSLRAGPVSQADILSLQQSHGNQAVQRLLAKGGALLV